jgi:ATP-dependent protease HslVU (ClpYQ) peptidase subunit
MTVIAWDGDTLAIDRQGQVDGMKYQAIKARALLNGDVVAYAGSLSQGLLLGDWYEAGAKKESWPEFQKDKDEWTLLIVANSKGCSFYEKLPVAIPVVSAFMAWGSGRDFAIGAMDAGCSAEQAVRIASRHSTSCGEGVDVFKLRETYAEFAEGLSARERWERREQIWDEACKRSDRGRIV